MHLVGYDRVQGTNVTMNLAAAMLYPIMLLLPVAGVTDGQPEGDSGSEVSSMPAREAPFQHVEPESAWQVRVEQRMTIRISPRASRPISPDMFVGLPEREMRARFSERKIGKCLSAGLIAGVQPDRENRLLLFMRDRRVISAELERACRARDFYSGFYLARSPDGQLCVDRDTLLSRSGMNCRLTRIRQLVEADR